MEQIDPTTWRVFMRGGQSQTRQLGGSMADG
jgi:hypothetical protein